MRSDQTRAMRVADRELLGLHAQGNPLAFDELLRRHRDRMWRLALRTLDDPEDAADAVQEACLSAFRAAGRFRGDAAVSTWLHRIVINACWDRARRNAVRAAVPLSEEAAEGQLPDPADAGGLALDVQSALARLSFDQRAALVLIDMLGFTVKDASRVLGIKPATVKSRCVRGRARLAPLLAQHRSVRA
ncbi:RNA polymerase sigma factor SigM [Actinomadura barringtoniae]|uniref:RNA polymerase sigma factor SigM n=1 Tax=Actinomadura barringtoniae TaxID=1427535 RepID=A0A939PMC0_9ACTN|nr:RNA polymerase sigma factor SigM [Actinomadura barringtoniae]MBO2455265.1 RNA polymerase sigma factor SigM [Actinomadura barringtoniae]